MSTPPASAERQDAPVPPSTTSGSIANHSSPIKASAQTRDRFAVTRPKKAADMQIQMANELSGQWVGPMPVAQFLKTFLPIDPHDDFGDMPLDVKKYFDFGYKIESDMYKPFIDLVHNLKFTRGFKFVNTSVNADPNASAGMKNKPDIGVYKEDVDLADKMQYSRLEVIWELKPSRDRVDPFDDPPEKVSEEKPEALGHCFEPTAQGRMKCRGQLGLYARNWFTRQHRIHGFIVWMGDPYARFIRLDRDGGIVSARFNFRTGGDLLAEFIYRICRSDDRARGIDTTVQLVTDQQQIALVKEKLDEWKPKDPNSHPIYRLELPDGTATRKVFVWAPMSEPQSLTGRATRGYPAWDPVLKKVIFVKDSWRSLEPGMEKETTILEKLNKHGVRNVPTLVCGDDLPGQFTLTKQYASCSWNVGGHVDDLCKRSHLRFGEDIVGLRLDRFPSSKAFVQAVFDAFIAHEDAYVKCRVLHRDISAGNVLMKPGGGGVLNDWDLARTVEEIESGPRQNFRSGTWQFMSIQLLEDPAKLHVLQDDLESFFWLVLYFILRYMAHEFSGKHLANKMAYIFDSIHTQDDESVAGGDGKNAVIAAKNSSPIPASFEVHGNQPLTTLHTALRKYVKDYHRFLDLQGEEGTDLGFTNIGPIDASRLALNDHVKMREAFDAALKLNNWPSGDAAQDRLTASKRAPEEGPEHEGSASKRSRTSYRSPTTSSLTRQGASGASPGSSSASAVPQKGSSGHAHGILKSGKSSGSHRRPL